MKVLVTGYTYTRQNLFDVFESYPEKQDLFFILPNNWTAKGGTVRFEPFTRPGFRIANSRAFFHSSDAPVVGGLFKGWMPFIVPRMAWLRFRHGVSVVFTAGEPNLLSTLYNAFFAKALGMRHVFHFWENIPYEEKDRGLKLRFKRAVIRLTIAFSDGAICGMHKAERILRSFDQHLPIGTFLHAGFDPERFRPGLEPRLRRDLGLDGDTTVFLFVGALGYRKGIHVALRALAAIKDAVPAHCIIVGSGEYAPELKNQVRELGLQSLVTFVPWMDNHDLPMVYNSADVFLYPSIPHQGWEEQFGYSIAEASLCGLPVISTRSGSIDEAMIDGQTGVMVTPNDVSGLAEAMLTLARDSQMRRRMGRAGREFIMANFSNQAIAAKMHEFFKRVCLS